MAKKTTLLVIGDDKDWDSFAKFLKEVRKHPLKNMHVQWANYAVVEPEITMLPNIEDDTIVVFLFFPFGYWDKNIEKKGYEGLYGSREFYTHFRHFWEKKIYKQIAKFYKGKKIIYINNPLNIHVDRDKLFTSETLQGDGIPTPPIIHTRKPEKIIKLLNNGKKLYVKPRYGSMGKGITYLEKENWKTNFRFEKGRIVSKVSDKGWTFVDITDNQEFLEELLKHKRDIIIEEAVDPMVLGDNLKFDLRLYVFNNEVLYIYPRANDAEAVTTNISQGGKGMKQDFLKEIPDRLIKDSIKAAIASSKSLHLGCTGVDIILDKNGEDLFVIELNAFPGFPGLLTGVKFNLSQKICDVIDKTHWS